MTGATNEITPASSRPLRPAARRPKRSAALTALDHLDRREREVRRVNRWRLLGGCAIVVSVFALTLLPVAWWASASRRLPAPTSSVIVDPAAPVPLSRRPTGQLARTVLAIDAALAVLMLPVAVCTRKPSRADRAQLILDQGCRSHGSRDNPFLRIALVVIAVGMLWGEFLIVEAAQSTWVAVRLRGVDRHRAALVLAMVRVNPIGIDPRLLLRAGERPADLRRMLAYLVANGWADINRGGDRLTEVSPARRRLRD